MGDAMVQRLTGVISENCVRPERRGRYYADYLRGAVGTAPLFRALTPLTDQECSRA